MANVHASITRAQEPSAHARPLPADPSWRARGRRAPTSPRKNPRGAIVCTRPRLRPEDSDSGYRQLQSEPKFGPRGAGLGRKNRTLFRVWGCACCLRSCERCMRPFDFDVCVLLEVLNFALLSGSFSGCGAKGGRCLC